MKYPEFFGTRFFQSALCIVEHDKLSGVSRVMASQWADTGCGHRKLNINTQEPRHLPQHHHAHRRHDDGPQPPPHSLPAALRPQRRAQLGGMSAVER